MAFWKIVCKVAPKEGDAVTVVRLIESPKAMSAIRHCTNDWLTCGPCTIEEAVQLGRDGVVIEKVSE